jgi:hypothetical protein
MPPISSEEMLSDVRDTILIAEGMRELYNQKRYSSIVSMAFEKYNFLLNKYSFLMPYACNTDYGEPQNSKSIDIYTAAPPFFASPAMIESGHAEYMDITHFDLLQKKIFLSFQFFLFAHHDFEKICSNIRKNISDISEIKRNLPSITNVTEYYSVNSELNKEYTKAISNAHMKSDCALNILNKHVSIVEEHLNANLEYLINIVASVFYEVCGNNEINNLIDEMNVRFAPHVRSGYDVYKCDVTNLINILKKTQDLHDHYTQYVLDKKKQTTCDIFNQLLEFFDQLNTKSQQAIEKSNELHQYAKKLTDHISCNTNSVTPKISDQYYKFIISDFTHALNERCPIYFAMEDNTLQKMFDSKQLYDALCNILVLYRKNCLNHVSHKEGKCILLIQNSSDNNYELIENLIDHLYAFVSPSTVDFQDLATQDISIMSDIINILSSIDDENVALSARDAVRETIGYRCSEDVCYFSGDCIEL